MKLIIVLSFICAFVASIASAAVLTNADVIKMSSAKLDDSIIITAIDNSEATFDTSVNGLIELSNAKVSKEVIAAIIKKTARPPKGTGAATAPATTAVPSVEQSDLMSPSEVLLVDRDVTHSMRYMTPQIRTAVRGLGFGGVGTYSVLYGVKATERTKNTSPSFIISVPSQAQPESYLTLASLAVRKNNTREVLIGGGYMSYSTGIHPDRVVPVTSEKAADQSRVQKGFIIYKVTPKHPLDSGEYAVILYTGEMHGLVSAWFTSNGNSYFDFGVDR